MEDEKTAKFYFEIQRLHLESWKKVLTDSAFEELYFRVMQKNLNAKNPYHICWGQSIDAILDQIKEEL